MTKEQEKGALLEAPDALDAPTVIPLSIEEQRAFAETLLNPPEPNEALRLAAKMYAERVITIV